MKLRPRRWNSALRRRGISRDEEASPSLQDPDVLELAAVADLEGVVEAVQHRDESHVEGKTFSNAPFQVAVGTTGFWERSAIAAFCSDDLTLSG